MMPSVPQMLIVLVIVFFIFGSKRIKQLGGDLGGFARGLREGIKGDPELEASFDKGMKDLGSTVTKKVADEVKKVSV